MVLTFPRKNNFFRNVKHGDGDRFFGGQPPCLEHTFGGFNNSIKLNFNRNIQSKTGRIVQRCKFGKQPLANNLILQTTDCKEFQRIYMEAA